jgi:hypothetical protein
MDPDKVVKRKNAKVFIGVLRLGAKESNLYIQIQSLLSCH